VKVGGIACLKRPSAARTLGYQLDLFMSPSGRVGGRMHFGPSFLGKWPVSEHWGEEPIGVAIADSQGDSFPWPRLQELLGCGHSQLPNRFNPTEDLRVFRLVTSRYLHANASSNVDCVRFLV